MERVAKHLLGVARKLVFDMDIVFVKSDSSRSESFNKIAYELGSYLELIGRNEGVETYTGRRDMPTAMELSIGIEDHASKDAILKAVESKAKKMGRRFGIKVIIGGF
jgi:hypothetical protein